MVFVASFQTGTSARVFYWKNYIMGNSEVRREALSLIESKAELYQLFKFICVDDVWDLIHDEDTIVDQIVELANAPVTSDSNRAQLLAVSTHIGEVLESLLCWLESEGEPIQRALYSVLSQLEHGEDERGRCRNEKRSWLSGKKTNIYMMLDEHTGLVKIGRSVNPPNREKTLQGQIPLLRMIWSCEGTHDDETQLHGIFSESRVRGEWFNLSKEDIKHVESLDWRK